MDTLLRSLKIRGSCKSIKEYRHFKIYDVELEHGQSIKKIENNAREIGLALKSLSIPIVTTIPAKGLVRIQTTTSEPELLSFDELYKRATPNNDDSLLPFLIGEQSSGEAVWIDMAANPHLLLSGCTGSGKSVLLHTLISNVKKRDDVLLYLVDPKHGVEFGQYNKLATIVYDYTGTIRMLERLHEEMEERYNLFRRIGIKNLKESPFVVPKVLVIIDEVADLMLQDKEKSNIQRGMFEKLLISIAQKSRAVGIHLVLATQRPSVDIITGLIKANFPARIACKVSSSIDSKVILDQAGAENLLGKGDALMNTERYHNVRLQIALSN
jgi:S-DNA-T family DNA segregation ATPase FtsK/SpoIIIE